MGTKTAYGLALAKEVASIITTLLAECVGGDMLDFGLSPRGQAAKAMKAKLLENGCPEGAAIVYMRPVLGYDVFDEEHGLAPYTPHYNRMYQSVLTGIAGDLLAQDGVFVVEIPPFTESKIRFGEGLQQHLGEHFTVSAPHRAPMLKVRPSHEDAFTTLTIRRK